MKLKPIKDKQPPRKAVKDIFSIAQQISAPSVSIDINGGICLENFEKLLNYTDNAISLVTKDKIVYIYGSNLTILNCNRYTASVRGNIDKIEIFPNGG